MLTKRKVSVIVRMHAQVRSLAQLGSTSKWFVSVLETRGLELHLLLVPAPKNAKPTAGKITLDSSEIENRILTVQFEQMQLLPMTRRVRRAEHEQSRLYA